MTKEFAPLPFELDDDEHYEKVKELSCDDDGGWY